MSRGLGPAQLSVLAILKKAGGVLAVGGILGVLSAKANNGEQEYQTLSSSLSRTLKALRERGLVETYTGISAGGHAVVVAAITGEGKKVAEGL